MSTSNLLYIFFALQDAFGIDYVLTEAVAQDNVKSQFNPNPVHPRLYKPKDATHKECLKRQSTAIADYYVHLHTLSVATLLTFAASKLSWGWEPLVFGTKPTKKTLIDAYKKYVHFDICVA